MAWTYHNGMPELPCADCRDHQALAFALRESGACLLQGFPMPSASAALRTDLLRLRDAGHLQPAAIGRAGDRRMREEIRGDRTLWLDDPRCSAAAISHLQHLDALRTELNRRLFLGMRSVEAHYAAYPAGAHYARHRDRFRDDASSMRSAARVLSLVSYLNTNWTPAEGGALRLHMTDGAIDVLPQEHTTVCFLSEIEHEVLPAVRERLSIAAWFRRDGN